MQDFLSGSKDIEDMLQRLKKRLFKEFMEEKPEANLDFDDGLNFWMEYLKKKMKEKKKKKKEKKKKMNISLMDIIYNGIKQIKFV